VPWQSAKKIKLSEKQKKILTGSAAGTHTPLHLKIRSQIILNAAKGHSNNAIEREMGLDAKTVQQWRDRYALEHEELKRAEAETPLKLRSMEQVE
jgi:DNA-binding NarL/FixJ family response regulator